MGEAKVRDGKMIWRWVLVAVIAAAVGLGGCWKKKADKKVPAAEAEKAPAAAPALEGVPEESPAVEDDEATASDVVVEGEAKAAPVKTKYDDYTYVVNPTATGGPPRPPIGDKESVTAEQLNEQWTEVAVEEPEGGGPKQLDTPLAAALDTATLNNRTQVLFTVAQMGDFDTFKAKFLPREEAYMEYLHQKGVEGLSDALAVLERKLLAQFEERRTRYKKLVGPVRRQDKFDGMLGQSMARLARYTFEYEDVDGARQTDCILFLLIGSGWQVLDLGCGEVKETK